jgi:hypothetical protein
VGCVSRSLCDACVSGSETPAQRHPLRGAWSQGTCPTTLRVLVFKPALMCMDIYSWQSAHRAFGVVVALTLSFHNSQVYNSWNEGQWDIHHERVDHGL